MVDGKAKVEALAGLAPKMSLVDVAVADPKSEGVTDAVWVPNKPPVILVGLPNRRGGAEKCAGDRRSRGAEDSCCGTRLWPFPVIRVVLYSQFFLRLGFILFHDGDALMSRVDVDLLVVFHHSVASIDGHKFDGRPDRNWCYRLNAWGKKHNIYHRSHRYTHPTTLSQK